MIRTPPNYHCPSADTPLPVTPMGVGRNKMSSLNIDRSDDAMTCRCSSGSSATGETPTPQASRSSPSLEDLSDEEIKQQIKNLQRLLEKRNKNKTSKKSLFGDSPPSDGGSPLGSSPGHHKPSLEKPTQGDSLAIKPPGAQAPADTHPRSQARRYPALPARSQRAQSNALEQIQPASRSDTNSQQREKTPIEKIPPIILRDKTQRAKVSSALKRKGINFAKAQNITDGIRIYPVTEADFRSLSKYFSAEAIPFHTYQVPSEKLLNVVLRSVLTEILEEDIYNDLQERGFTPECIIRMRRPRDKAPMPLVLVKIDKKYKDIYREDRQEMEPLRSRPSDKDIYHLKEIVSLDISVEPLRSRPSVGQCFRCQRFGHAQSRCSAPRKCVACAGEHEARDCLRPKCDPATCANCGEQHPANYRGCPRFPKSRAQPQNPQRQPSPSGNRSTETHSYAHALSGARSIHRDSLIRPRPVGRPQASPTWSI
ncbi:zinc finger associated protein [Popillia japonica]|uniref:Zinc finger associated protein n=1 Tax=Popillia japonica TaxID=7064 RepID=A0AAW1KFW6_POPJA